ncbi:MAG: hypothetical protein NTY99_03360 [DPANN group archaeon]|nr:hypothetical protein [DPANN group archaeon]
MAVLKETKITKPDLVEATLVVILALWIITVLWLISTALKQGMISLLTIDSLAMFFLAFISITVLVIAIVLADVRKELKEVY